MNLIPMTPVRLGPDDRFWLVIDATSASVMEDVLFQTSLRTLELQFKGGLTAAQCPTLYTDRAAALADARARMVAAKAARAIGQALAAQGTSMAKKVQLTDGDGRVVMEAEL